MMRQINEVIQFLAVVYVKVIEFIKKANSLLKRTYSIKTREDIRKNRRSFVRDKSDINVECYHVIRRMKVRPFCPNVIEDEFEQF
jgi:pimeloyl-CoA synthetase